MFQYRYMLEVHMNVKVQKKIDEWLQDDYDSETKKIIEDLQKTNPQELHNAFHTELSFGTGGLRGLMGIGPNRINRYTIRRTTQGVANYVQKQYPNKVHTAVIGYDSRIHSKEFAEEAASVLSANHIHVFISSTLCPTPFISFACRFHKCSFAIMITASHNPKEYNGYKLYWSDGAQVLSPHLENIVSEIHRIKYLSQIKQRTVPNQYIQSLHLDVEKIYLDAITNLTFRQNMIITEGSHLRIVYTPLHGTGVTLVPRALKMLGFSNLHFVQEQMKPDGSFPSIVSPNPEQLTTLELGIDLLQKLSSDIVIATDPDADRMAVVVQHNGKNIHLNGNEVAALLLYYICISLRDTHTLPKNSAIVFTIVTTELLRAIADHFLIHSFEVLTGFKYIAEKIRKWDETDAYHFLFGAEESCGYLYGDYCRDKDGVAMSCLIAEVALYAKLRDLTLVDLLDEIYERFGIYQERQLSLCFPQEGNQMEKFMDKVRTSFPENLCGIPIISWLDYKKEISGFPTSDVLSLRLKDKTKIVIRPSGTEPKVKIYVMAQEPYITSVEHAINVCHNKIIAFLDEIKKTVL